MQKTAAIKITGMQNCDSLIILLANSTAILDGLSSMHLQFNQPLLFKTIFLPPSSRAPAVFVPTLDNISNLDETKYF